MTEVHTKKPWSRVAAFLALEPNVVAVSTAMFLLALGENLWQKFLPKYLQALGAPIRAIGLFGSVEDFLDGVYQYPGGWLSDRLGRRPALLTFVALATIGYGIYFFAPSWPWVIAGLLFVAAWSSMGNPTRCREKSVRWDSLCSRRSDGSPCSSRR